jgi:hypothetical protein
MLRIALAAPHRLFLKAACGVLTHTFAPTRNILRMKKGGAHGFRAALLGSRGNGYPEIIEVKRSLARDFDIRAAQAVSH